MAEYTPTRHLMVKEDLLQIKNGLDKLFANGQVATQYCDPEGNITMNEEWNVNGSYCAIEGITSPDGRVLGKMAHSERRNRSVAMNIYGEQDMKIFESGVKILQIMNVQVSETSGNEMKIGILVL